MVKNWSKKDLHERLLEVRDELNRMAAVKCRMAHERVLIDPQTKLPVAGISPEMEFRRRDLCPAAKRNTNLACSHTMARYCMAEALDVLEQTGNNRADWRAELDNLNNLIYRLDRRKSDAEKQSAQIVKNLSEAEENMKKILLIEQNSINGQIAVIERDHNNCVERIEILKHKILAALDSVI
jgi:hypothetical protein